MINPANCSNNKGLSTIALVFIGSLGLQSCGGDGSGNSDDNGVTSFIVNTNAGANGTISPTSTSINYNDNTSFTITPNTGYVIDTVDGCDGTLSGNTHTTGPIIADCTVSASFTINYTVSTNAGANGTISPTSASVKQNGNTSFTVTPDSGYAIDTVNGCSGSLSGDTYTAGPVNADCSVSASFVLAVTALFPTNGTNWNDYVSDKEWSTAIDSTCIAGTDSACLHGGELRVVQATNKTDCTNLTAADDLGTFTWVCDNSTGTARLISTGLADGKSLSDLIDFTTPGFKPNAVTIYENGIVWDATPSDIWWSNPFIINNIGGSLNMASTLYLVTSNPGTDYSLDANKLAFVIQPGVTLTGSFTSTEVIGSSIKDHLWIEGNIDASGVNYGVRLIGARFSVLRKLVSNNSDIHGVLLSSSQNNTLSEVTVANTKFVGLSLSGSGSNTLSNITAVNNTNVGVDLSLSDLNTLSNITATNNGVHGLQLFNGQNNTLSDITTTNNGNTGILLFNGQNNTLSDVTTANNGEAGVHLSNGTNNTLSDVTTVNNLVFGLLLSSSTSNTLSNITVGNSNFGFYLDLASSNTFTGLIEVGNNGADCFVSGGTDQGLTDATCATNGTSDFTLITGITLANAFVGKVTGNDVQNASDTNGAASFPVNPTSFDWSQFDNYYRSWGTDGSVFPNADQQGKWSTGSGRIWDWSVSTGDTGNGGSPVLLGVKALPTGNDTLTHIWSGTPISNDNFGCGHMVTGSVWNGSACETTFLRNAVEISTDDIGNDNTLCETGETCLYTPNIGSYQGHGNLITAGTFTDGTQTGITLMKYDSNGR